MTTPGRGRSAWFVLGTVALSLLISRPATAGGSDDRAQQRFREGVEAARQERWVEARGAFEEAYGLSRRPVVLINLAGAQARTGRLLEAARNYRRILDDAPSAETAPFRKASSDVLPALEARIPKVRLRPSDLRADDVVEIDDVRVPSEQIATWQPLDPGPHTLVVKRAGVERARVTFSLAERESHDISLPVAVPPALVSGPPASGPAHPGASLSASEAGAVQPPPRTWWSSPRLWAAVAGVVLVTAGVVALTVERGEQAFSGNVPPGSVSVR